MHLPINVKSPNNISKWQMEFNSAFKGLNAYIIVSFTELTNATAGRAKILKGRGWFDIPTLDLPFPLQLSPLFVSVEHCFPTFNLPSTQDLLH
jgi:hypothetical protein